VGTDYSAESNVVDRHVRNPRARLQNDWRRPRFIMRGRRERASWVGPMTLSS